MSKLALVEITDPTSPAAGELERSAHALAERCRVAGWLEECFAALYLTVQLARARGDTNQVAALGQHLAALKPQDPFPRGLLGQGPAVAWPQGFVQPAAVNDARRAVDRLLAQLDGVVPAVPPPPPAQPAPPPPPAQPVPPPAPTVALPPQSAAPPGLGGAAPLDSDAALAQLYMQESVEAPFPSELDDPLMTGPALGSPGLSLDPPLASTQPAQPIAGPPGFLSPTDADRANALPSPPAAAPLVPPPIDGLEDLAGLDLAGLDDIPLDAADPLALGVPPVSPPAAPPAGPAVQAPPQVAASAQAPSVAPLDQSDRSLLLTAESVHLQLVEQLVGMTVGGPGEPGRESWTDDQLIQLMRVCGLVDLPSGDFSLILRKARDGY